VNSSVLVDTDVFSFVARRDRRADAYLKLIGNSRVMLSFMTVAELYAWGLRRGWGESRRLALEEKIAHCLLLNPDEETARLWARISNDRRKAGRPIECADCWIAATATRHQIALVTHNARDYSGIPGLAILTSGE
jgi:tRNA(fMet)-specific endonuclease VapC